MAITFVIPDPVEQEMRRLRRECAKFRVQRNEARAEVAQLQAEIEALRAAGVRANG